jgi:hypothetical protein
VIIARATALAAVVLVSAGALSGCSIIPDLVGKAQDGVVLQQGGCPDSALDGFKSGFQESVKGTDAEAATIELIDASEFSVPEIGDDMLGSGCYFRVSFDTGGQNIVLDEAMLPQGGDAKATVGGRLVDAGFATDDSVPDSYVNSDGRNVTLVDSLDEATLSSMGGAYSDGVLVVTAYSIN